MEIKPASFDQLARGRNGKRILITADVGNVARDIQAIEPNLELHFNEDGMYYEIRGKDVNGKEYMVTSALELDQRLVERIRKVIHPTYDFTKESEEIERKYKKDQRHKEKEEVGVVGEELAHAMRKDKGIKKNF